MLRRYSFLFIKLCLEHSFFCREIMAGGHNFMLCSMQSAYEGKKEEARFGRNSAFRYFCIKFCYNKTHILLSTLQIIRL